MVRRGEVKHEQGMGTTPVRRRGRNREDALRWIVSLVITAVLASAVTSAVFLSVRPKPTAPSPEEMARAARQRYDALAASLEQTASAGLATNFGPPAVDVVYHTGPLQEGEVVPMVSTSENMLGEATTVPWQLSVTSTQRRRRFGRIVDIRRSASLRRPGYFGLVELEVETARRQSEASGQLPLEPPEGYEVISTAKYTELQKSDQYGREVIPASAVDEQVGYHYEEWKPVEPPPSELPETVRARFNETIVNCISADPDVVAGKQTLTFFYALADGKWMPAPARRGD